MHTPVVPDIASCNRVITCRRPGPLRLPKTSPFKRSQATTHTTPGSATKHTPTQQQQKARKSPIALHPRQKPSHPLPPILLYHLSRTQAKPITSGIRTHLQPGSGAKSRRLPILTLPIVSARYCNLFRSGFKLLFTKLSEHENAERSYSCFHSNSTIPQPGLRKVNHSQRKNEQKHTNETSNACTTLKQSSYAERFLPLGGGRGAE
jgi:hypothetical protein